MPMKRNIFLLFLSTMILLVVIVLNGFGYEGISTYYVRYDVKSVNNRITNDNLLIIPAEDEFRVENFSIISMSGDISAEGFSQTGSKDQMIRDHVLKTILVEKGLKSVTSKDAETTISYEGSVKLPATIQQKRYHQSTNRLTYEAEIEFSPISFPDKWDSMRVKKNIKNFFYEFFNLFR